MNTYELICDFLGLTPANPSFDDVRNASPVVADLPTNIASMFIGYYSETYEYMRKAYPCVDGLWSDSYSYLAQVEGRH